MIKRILYILCLLWATNICAQSIGDWKIHPVFGGTYTNIIDTDNIVYYLSDNYLYSYNKQDDETTAYTKRTNLSDIEISNIYYNNQKDYLLITYDNGNIDIMYDNGKIVNIPDILNSSINTTKNINDVKFSDKGVFLATEFGYVVMNDDKMEIKSSVFLNKKVYSIGVLGNKLLLSLSDGLYAGNVDKQGANMSDFVKAGYVEPGEIFTLKDNSILYKAGWIYKSSISDNYSVENVKSVIESGCSAFRQINGGFICYDSNNNLIQIDDSGKITSTTTIPENLISSIFSTNDNDGSVWAINSKGVCKVKIGESGNETILVDYITPNASTVKIPYYLIFNKNQDKLYVMNTGTNRFFDSQFSVGVLSSFDGSFWKNEIPDYAKTLSSNQNNNKINSPYYPIFDPDDSNTYYVGTWFEGAYKVTDGKVVQKFDWTNSPLIGALNGYYCNANGLTFDKNKNLWWFQPDNSTSPIMVLPRNKQSLTTFTEKDWITPKVSDLRTSKKMHFYITSKDIKIYNSGDFEAPLIIFNDNGNPSGPISSKSYTTLTDQDGKEYKWLYINCFVEDLNGKIWMGTNNGVVEFVAQNGLNANFTINHLKVPRNDGTNYADYLLNDTEVTCIAVDGSNRKWIGTSSSGLLLVSADGSQILKQFTTDNSYLSSNKIISVLCNPTNNSVYVGTTNGLLEYLSDSSPSAESFSSVYAYPNPVRPDYTGIITINGLMDNSLVKIADAAGNVVKTLESNGGIATWDGCNSNNERVKSGVYYVLASSHGESKSGAVTKIVIIR